MANELKELKADLKALRQQIALMQAVLDNMGLKISELEGGPTLKLLYQNSSPRILELLRQVTINEFEITLEKFNNPTGYGESRVPRFMFCHAALHHGIGASEIGRFIHRDHSTVINSCKRLLVLMKRNPNLLDSYQRILKALDSKEVRKAS